MVFQFSRTALQILLLMQLLDSYQLYIYRIYVFVKANKGTNLHTQ